MCVVDAELRAELVVVTHVETSGCFLEEKPQNKNQLRILDCAAPGLVRLRAPGGAQDMALYIAAAKAARMRDLQAHVVTAEGKHRALALWDHSRDWDPGD